MDSANTETLRNPCENLPVSLCESSRNGRNTVWWWGMLLHTGHFHHSIKHPGIGFSLGFNWEYELYYDQYLSQVSFLTVWLAKLNICWLLTCFGTPLSIHVIKTTLLFCRCLHNAPKWMIKCPFERNESSCFVEALLSRHLVDFPYHWLWVK